MGVALRHSRRFSASSPVTRYWLANCVGFAVSGGGRGTVERVVADHDPHMPSFLEVRTKRRRLRRVPASAVVAVVPSERLLLVERSDRRPVSLDTTKARANLDRGGRIAGHLLGVAATLLLVGLARAWELARAGWTAARPVVVSASRRSWRESVRLVRSVPWQRYGRSARSATTRLWQARSTASSRRRTTSSTRIGARRSED